MTAEEDNTSLNGLLSLSKSSSHDVSMDDSLDGIFALASNASKSFDEKEDDTSNAANLNGNTAKINHAYPKLATAMTSSTASASTISTCASHNSSSSSSSTSNSANPAWNKRKYGSAFTATSSSTVANKNSNTTGNFTTSSSSSASTSYPPPPYGTNAPASSYPYYSYPPPPYGHPYHHPPPHPSYHHPSHHHPGYNYYHHYPQTYGYPPTQQQYPSQGSAVSVSTSSTGNKKKSGDSTGSATSNTNAKKEEVKSVSIGSTKTRGALLSSKMNNLSVHQKQSKESSTSTSSTIADQPRSNNHMDKKSSSNLSPKRSNTEEKREEIIASLKTPANTKASQRNKLHTSPIHTTTTNNNSTESNESNTNLPPLPSPDDSLGAITGHFTPLPMIPSSKCLSSSSSSVSASLHARSAESSRASTGSSNILSPNFKILEGCLSWSVSKSTNTDDSFDEDAGEQRDDWDTTKNSSTTTSNQNWRSTFSPFPMMLSSKHHNTGSKESPTKFGTANKVSIATSSEIAVPTPNITARKQFATPTASSFSPFYNLGALFSPAGPHPMTPYGTYPHMHGHGPVSNDRVRNLRGNINCLHKHAPGNSGTMPYPSSMASPLVAHPVHYSASYCNTNNTNNSKCYALKQPLPNKFQGDMSRNMTRSVPDFTNLINYPPTSATSSKSSGTTTSSSSISKICVMCGKLCPVSQGKKSKSNNGNGGSNHISPIIPSQNKGLCTSCDVNVWVVIDSSTAGHPDLLQIKWCKGCKNFRPWASFGEKGLATKCVRCRTRQREKYALQKKEKETCLSTLTNSCSIKVLDC